jgi:hypothetical protein
VCKDVARLAVAGKTKWCHSAGCLGDGAGAKRIKACRVKLGASRGHVLVPSVSSELPDIGDDILVELHVDTHLQSDHGLVNRQGAENSIFEPECCVPWFLNNETGSNPFYSNKKEERDRDDCI